MKTSATQTIEVHPYVQLQREIRQQHPEWIQPNGDSPICDSYESRFAELLCVAPSIDRRAAA
jgi:hypothetical protein